MRGSPNPRAPMLEKMVWSQPGIGLEQPEIRYREDCAYGSICLGYAIRCLLNQMPERLVRDVLGAEPVREPGTERVHYGQGAERRLAA